MYETNEEQDEAKIARLLTFAIGPEEYAIGIEWVMEIVSMQKITPIPQMPAYVKGVINLRGVVLAVMDARRRFAMEDRAYDQRTCIVVTRVGQHTYGLIVDAVRDVSDIPTQNIDQSSIATAGRHHFVSGIAKVGDEIKILLNAESLFDMQSEVAAPGVDEQVHYDKVA
jgi:purine-binding chemotaxis protein CheW